MPGSVIFLRGGRARRRLWSRWLPRGYERSASRCRTGAASSPVIGCTSCSVSVILGQRTAATTLLLLGSRASLARQSMRPPVDASQIRTLARELERIARAPVRIYLTGGSTAVLEGWRESTVDVDLRFEPEADELMRALPALKERLGVNIELASPPDFIPELPRWRQRSPLVFSEGRLSVHHFDPYSQALSKIERGFKHDLADLSAMIDRGLVEPAGLRALYEEIEPELYRYPAIDPPAFRRKLNAALDRS